ncbi:uncharacterized protein ARMOST_15777 [Armillaria ostoyae]|uniref:Uncharacterized protein n=1 Tax=Armillaria ostoyae TaxID=47428 RepID=A0A284RUF2_ARMOS|nr:uncharacterized protein ARMOST_15777 [Armillaria ostoyae]
MRHKLWLRHEISRERHLSRSRGTGIGGRMLIRPQLFEETIAEEYCWMGISCHVFHSFIGNAALRLYPDGLSGRLSSISLDADVQCEYLFLWLRAVQRQQSGLMCKASSDSDYTHRDWISFRAHWDELDGDVQLVMACRIDSTWLSPSITIQPFHNGMMFRVEPSRTW